MMSTLSVPPPNVDTADNKASFSYASIPFCVNTGLFINNSFVASVRGKKMAVHNPATGGVVVHVHEADKEDVDIAVLAAEQVLFFRVL